MFCYDKGKWIEQNLSGRTPKITWAGLKNPLCSIIIYAEKFHSKF